jgi:hypothetical protein
MAAQLRERPAPDLLVNLRELAADRGRAVGSEHRFEISQGRPKAMGYLEEDQRGAIAAMTCEQAAPLGALARQVSEKGEGVSREAAGDQPRQRRRGAGNRSDVVAVLPGGADQRVPRVRNPRRAGIGDQGYIAVLQRAQQRRQSRGRAVLVITDLPGVQAVAAEEFARPTRVFAGNERRLLQDTQGPQRDVLQVSDRGRDHIQRAHKGILADAQTLRRTPEGRVGPLLKESACGAQAGLSSPARTATA